MSASDFLSGPITKKHLANAAPSHFGIILSPDDDDKPRKIDIHTCDSVNTICDGVLKYDEQTCDSNGTVCDFDTEHEGDCPPDTEYPTYCPGPDTRIRLGVERESSKRRKRRAPPRSKRRS